MNVEANLNIAVPTIPDKVDHLKINSVSEYIIFDDLLRPLIKFDSNGEIAPDLVQSWEIQDNFKKFIFTINPNQYFSDHSIITVQDIINSFNHLMSNPEIIHGDGFKIKKIYSLNETQFVIEILESNPFFITELSSPEFRIIKSSSSNYKITSGAYSIESISKKSLKMTLNKHYPTGIEVKHKIVTYSSYNQNELLRPQNFKYIDIIWPKSSISESEMSEFLKNGFNKYELNLGFSYWLSLNPNTLKKLERVQIKKKLDLTLNDSNFFSQNNLTRSRQLFLPYGPGRLSEIEINKINEGFRSISIVELKKMKVLLPKNIQRELLENFKNAFKNSDFSFYSDFNEYDQMIKKTTYDICMVNNDLSSIDLRSSLIVTFNKSRPLVFLDDHSVKYNELLKKITTSLDSTKRYAVIKNLGENILNDTIVYPLFYKYGFLFVKNGIDLSLLNKSGAETSSWKIK